MRFALVGVLAGLLAFGSARIEHTHHVEDHADPNVDVVVDVYQGEGEYQEGEEVQEGQYIETEVEVVDESGEPELDVQIARERTGGSSCCQVKQEKIQSCGCGCGCGCPYCSRRAPEPQPTCNKCKAEQEKVESVQCGSSCTAGSAKRGKQDTRKQTRQWDSRQSEPIRQEKWQGKGRQQQQPQRHSTVRIEHHTETQRTEQRQGKSGHQGHQQGWGQKQSRGGQRQEQQHSGHHHGHQHGHGHGHGHHQGHNHGHHGHHGNRGHNQHRYGGRNQEL